MDMHGIYARLAHVRPLLALASDKVEREDGPLAYGETAGCVRFALSTSGYGHSPPSGTRGESTDLTDLLETRDQA